MLKDLVRANKFLILSVDLVATALALRILSLKDYYTLPVASVLMRDSKSRPQPRRVVNKGLAELACLRPDSV